MNIYLNGKVFFAVVACVVLLSLQMRIQAVLETDVDHPLRSDAKDYVVYAQNLHAFGVYSRFLVGQDGIEPKPDAVRVPVYSLFLSFFVDDKGITKKAYDLVLVVQALLSTLVVVMCFFFFKPVIGAYPAIFASTLTALSPHLINANIYFLTETLFCFFITLFFFVAIKGPKNELRYHDAVLAGVGVTLALSSLTRPWVQYFIILYMGIYWRFSASTSTRRDLMVIFLSFFGVMLVWFVRNVISFGMISDSSLMSISLHHGMYPGFMHDGLKESFGYPYLYDPNVSEFSGSMGSVLAEIFRRFVNDPVLYLKWYFIEKPFYVLSWDMIQGMGDSFVYPVTKSPYFYEPHFILSHVVMKFIHAPVMVLGVVGCIVSWLPGRINGLSGDRLFYVRSMSALILYFLVVHSIVAPFPRYSIPIRPLVYGMASYQIYMIFLWIKKSGRLQPLFRRIE